MNNEKMKRHMEMYKELLQNIEEVIQTPIETKDAWVFRAAQFQGLEAAYKVEVEDFIRAIPRAERLPEVLVLMASVDIQLREIGRALAEQADRIEKETPTPKKKHPLLEILEGLGGGKTPDVVAAVDINKIFDNDECKSLDCPVHGERNKKAAEQKEKNGNN